MKGNLYGGMLQNLQLQPMTHVADHAGADGTGVGSHSRRFELIHWAERDYLDQWAVLLSYCYVRTQQSRGSQPTGAMAVNSTEPEPTRVTAG